MQKTFCITEQLESLSNTAYNINNNKKFRFFKSKENIHKKEDGPYHGFGY